MTENLPLPVHLSLPFLETTLMNNMQIAAVGAESVCVWGEGGSQCELHTAHVLLSKEEETTWLNIFRAPISE